MIDHTEKCFDCNRVCDIEELSEFNGRCWECHRKTRDLEFQVRHDQERNGA